MGEESIKNYFEIFSAADKEMIHSAMLELLFDDNFFRERLFPGVKFPVKPGFKREYVLPETRLRCDLVIKDGENPVLYLENKFNSFPTRKQLADYDSHIKSGAAKFLLAFNAAALGDCLTENTGWNVLAYRDVKAAIKEYLEKTPGASARKRLLLQEYADYLEKYIRQYDDIIDSPKLLNKLKTEHDHDYNLFCRLFLGNIATRLNRDIPKLVISTNSGGATEPLLDIYPPDWNKIPYKGSPDPKDKEKWPKIFMQLQGAKIKFYLRWREAGNGKKKDLDPKLVQSILEYLGNLEGIEDIGLEHIKSRMASQNASCTICERPFTLTDNIEDSVRQVLDFYHEIDRAVRENGKFV